MFMYIYIYIYICAPAGAGARPPAIIINTMSLTIPRSESLV